MTARFRHRAGIAAASLAGLMLGVAFMLALMWQFAHAQGVDPVVASDHAVRTVAAVAPPDAPDPAPSLLDRALDVAGPIGRGALGGMALLAVGHLMAWAREKRRWLRRGVVGSIGAVVVAVLLLFGGVLAAGGSVPFALTTVGSAVAGGALLSRDPKTMRRVPDEQAAAGEDVPT